MEFWEGVVFILLILISIIVHARKTSKIKARIKAQANEDYERATEIPKEELQRRLGEADLMYEELEKTYWVHLGIAIGMASYFYWHIWYLSLGIGLLIVFIGDNCLSIKPFVSGIPDK